MQLIRQEKDGCVYASLAMVLGIKPAIAHQNFRLWGPRGPAAFPFPPPWDALPRVPSMHEICEMAAKDFKVGFVPFEFDPEVAPHPDCPPIKVWGHEGVGQSARDKFKRQLGRGPGLIEGTKGDKGHMVAWNGEIVYDPRGYCYSLDVSDRFDFNPRRFWLKVKL